MSPEVAQPEYEADRRFYITGGSLPDDALSYIARQADEDLRLALEQNFFCYVLETRQVGKSSLMVKTARHLRGRGYQVVVLDLSSPGQNVSVEQWYFGLLYSAASQLGLEEEMEDFWTERRGLSPAQRWIDALREVALAHVQSPIVIFLDETDAVRSLPFSADEFFAVLRACYNRRTQDPQLHRLTFCLIGVATPAQLIRDSRTTPFNIGRRIELTDFTREEAAPLANGLGMWGGSPEQRQALLDRVLYWTGGHPYLTQRLCAAVAQSDDVSTAAQVDAICQATFLTRQTQETDPNLAFARDRMLGGDGADAAEVLLLYDRVRSGRSPVRYDPTDARADVLRLSGVVKVVEGNLVLRNRLYARAFDRRWIRANMPDEEMRRQRRAVWRGVMRASLLWVVVLFALVAVFHQSRRVEALRGNLERERYSHTLLESERESIAADVRRQREMLRRMQSDRTRVEAQLRKTRSLQAQASADLDVARKRAAEERRISTQMMTRYNAMSGELASAFSLKPERGVQAIQYALRAVDLARGHGTRPSRATVRGLIDAVDAGVIRRVVLKHPEGVLTASYSPDGRYILSSAKGRYAYLWHADSGRLLHRLPVQRNPNRRAFINLATFSPNGRYILTAADENSAVRLWDASKLPEGVPRPIRLLQADQTVICYAEFAPDSRRVAAIAANGDIRIIDVRTGASRLLGVKAVDSGRYLWTVSFSHDGQMLVTAGSDGSVRVYNARSGALLAQHRRHSDLEQQQPVYTGVTSARFDSTDRLVYSTGQNAVTYAWDWRSDNIHRKWLGHTDWVWNAYETNDGNYVSTSGRDRKTFVWVKGGLRVPRFTVASHTGQVFSTTFSPDGREMVTASDDRTAQVWRFTHRAFYAGSSVEHAEFSPDGRQIVMACADGEVQIRDTDTGKSRALLPHRTAVICATFSPNGRYLATAQISGEMHVWDVNSPSAITPRWSEDRVDLSKDDQQLYKLAFSSDSRLLAVGGPIYSMRVFSADKKDLVGGNDRYQGFVTSGAVSPDHRRMLIASRDNSLEIRDLRSGDLIRRFLLSGRRIGYEVRHLYGPNDAIFSPDGRFVLSGDRDGQAYLWNASTGKLAGMLKGHTREVLSVAFSADGKRIATSSDDTTVRLWSTGDVIAAWQKRHSALPEMTIRSHQEAVKSVRFSPDGQWIITASRDCSARLFPSTVEGYARRARQVLKDAGHPIP